MSTKKELTLAWGLVYTLVILIGLVLIHESSVTVNQWIDTYLFALDSTKCEHFKTVEFYRICMRHHYE